MLPSQGRSIFRKSSLLLVVLAYCLAANPAFAADPTTPPMMFVAMEGGSNPKNQTVTITNSGSKPMTWTVSKNASWLTVSPTSGTTTTGPDLVTVSVDITGLTNNTYSSVITLSGQGSSQEIPVKLTVSAPGPTLSQSPGSLTFAAMEGAGNPTSQSISIKNAGKGTLNWSASKNADWLTLTPASGETTTETDTIKVSVKGLGVKTGTYTTTITLTDQSASNSPQTIPVTMVITAAHSGAAVLRWDPNPESDHAGYKVYVGRAPRSYASPIDVGNVTTHKIVGLLPGQTYYFTVTAYDKSGNESVYASEVQKTIQ